MGQSFSRALRSIAGLSVLLLQGCLVAAAAGASSGIYLTSRGAEVVAERTVADLARRTEAEFATRKIVIESSSVKEEGDEREYQGKSGDLDVTVRIERKTPSTSKIEVTARRNLATWDKEYAQGLLARIVGS